MHKTNSIKAIVKIAFIVMCGHIMITGCRSDIVRDATIVSMEQMKLKAIDIDNDMKEVMSYPKRPKQKVHLAAVGDIMVHRYQLQRAYRPEKDCFDFTSSFAPMKEVLSGADYTVGNLETTLAGKDAAMNEDKNNPKVSDSIYQGFSGYPRFSSPDSVIDSLIDVGFDLVSTGNNHSLDQGIAGLLRTIDVCEEKGLEQVGTYKNRQQELAYKRVTLKGMTFAFVNYTYGTNGREPDDIDRYVNTLHNYNHAYYPSMIETVEEAKASPVDFVIVMMHYGYEYKSIPSRVQQEINEHLFDAGADVILGGHSHTLQPLEVYKEWNGKVLDSPKLVIYSLGNFIASQRNVIQFNGDTDIGVVLTLQFEKDDLQAPRLTGFDVLPTYTLWESDAIMTLPVTEKEIDNSSYRLKAWDRERIAYAYERVPQFLTQYLKDSDCVKEQAQPKDGIHHYTITK